MKFDNTKSGNPYHDEEGKFTEKDNVGSKSENFDISSNDELEDDDENYDFDIEGDEELDEDLDDVDDIDLDDLDDEYDFDMEENRAELSQKDIDLIDSLDFGDVEEVLINAYVDEFDKQKIFNASEQELKELLKAKKLIEQKNKLVASNEELNNLNDRLFENLWQHPVSAADWLKLKENWDNKLNYFLNWYNKDDKKQKIADLFKFKELGELYEQSYNELVGSFKRAEELVNFYQDPANAYSQVRKDKAVWISNGSISESEKVFGPRSKEVQAKLKAENLKALKAIKFYTDSYHIINEPLRGEMYQGSDGSIYGFKDTVNYMTDAIDESTYDFDYWVQRSTSALKINDKLTINGNTDLSVLQGLVGKEFKHQSFYSAGSAKDTGYGIYRDVMINTYCPKGTKGIYVQTGISSHSGENEMILQRGYSYKITKVEKHGGRIYLDVDVILGSDEDKYDDDMLEYLQSNNISANKNKKGW